MEPELLAAEIARTRTLTRKPFAVNLITISPRYKEHLRVALDAGVETIVFAGSFPRQAEIAAAKASGARVLSFASTEALARRLVDSGTDGLILEGNEAGGHIGPVSLGILLQQVLFKVNEVPVFVAGGIATGAYMAHLLLMGAAGVQMGTFFVLTEECSVHPSFKETFRKAKAKDAVATPQLGSALKVIPVRALWNRGTEAFLDLQLELIWKRKRREITHEEAQHRVEMFWMGGLRRAVRDGDVDAGSVMAGQSVGIISEILPMREALERLVAEAGRELDQVRGRL
jgi:enoyl-[acyl-carrier protein] reductase II